jgi:hypothetical protein
LSVIGYWQLVVGNWALIINFIFYALPAISSKPKCNLMHVTAYTNLEQEWDRWIIETTAPRRVSQSKIQNLKSKMVLQTPKRIPSRG